MGALPAYDTAVAALLAISLLVVVVSRAIRRAGLGYKLFQPWVQFITRDDIAASIAEEEADKLRLKLHSGEASVKDTPLVDVLPASTANESTPLLKPTANASSNTKKHTWRTVLLAILGAPEVAGRVAVLSVTATQVAQRELNPTALASPIIFLVAWVYATLKPIARPGLTVPYGVLSVHIFSLLQALGVLYAVGLNFEDEAAHTGVYLASHIANGIISFLGVSIIMGMPLHLNGEPTIDEDKLLPAKDDFVTLYGWLSFNWMTEFVGIGAKRAVEESDIWQLSYLLRARVVMSKFRHFQRSSLLRRILAANALDLTCDFVFTIVSASLSVAQPFLLNLTLRALESEEALTGFNAASSAPMHSMALALPDAYYTYPARVIHSATAYLGFAPGSSLYAFSTAMVTPSTGGQRDARQMAYFYATVSFICGLVKAQTDLQHLYFSRRAAVRSQSELIGSIYEKSLVRKDITGAIASDAKKKKVGKDGKKDGKEEDKAVESADVGKIVSLIATDATQCSNVANMLTRVYEIPIFFAGSCWLLYSLMGWTAFIGYVTFLFAMPVNWVIMGALWKLRKTLLDVRDKRMREMNQVIQAIKFIKFFAWEAKWVDRVMEARAREMQWLRKSKWLNFSMSFFWDVIPLVVTVISFMGFVLISKGELTVAIAFPALSGFSLLTQALTMIPMIANWLIQTYASIVRIEKYLDEDEVPEWVSWQSPRRAGVVSPLGDADFDERVGFSNANFAWVSPNKEAAPAADAKKNKAAPKPPLLTRIKSVFKKAPKVDAEAPAIVVEEEEEEDKPFELHNLDLFFKLGEINLLSGPTGSGKSSVLSALLGEMQCTSGEVHLPKSPLRVDPVTGLRNDVSFCAQQPWLQHQSIKDNILFGLAFDEKRYNDVLRVCQLNTDLDLLEDGDSTEIGEKGVSLSGGQKARVALARAVYSRSKTVLLDDVLSAVDSHTAEKLIAECLAGPLMKGRTIVLVTHHVDLIISRCAYVVQLEEGTVAAQGTPDELRRQGLLSAIRETAAKEEKALAPVGDEIAEQEEAADAKDAKEKPARKLVEKEEKAEGRVKLAIYHVYLKAASYTLMAIGVALVLVHYAGDVSQKFWIRFWGEAYDKHGDIGLGFPRPQDDVWPYLGGYIALQVLTALITVLSQLPSIYSSLKASRELYHAMLLSVIRAPSRWFDKTPSGRILNRFSKDVDTIDSSLNQFMLVVIETSVASLVTIATILWGAPLFIFPLIVIAGLQAYISRGYVTVSRDMRRIESNTRSPIIASFSELINGIATVRAFGTERFFVDKIYKRLDRVQAASYYYWMCNRWLLYRLDSMGAFVILFATLISIASGISSGLAGIVISSSSGLIMNLYWLLRFYTELEQSMNSVERINEYLDVPSEPPAIIEGSRPPAYWPSNQGGVSVENLVLKYSPELEPVLHGVSFDIKPTEKIGLVGRTGSGKSTLALAFFRFVDPTEGKIIIDGVDITSIGLQDLRSRLTIIPQDAVLFAGTIRDNLDPFNEHSDEDCLDALRRVQLRTSASPASTANPSRQSSRPGTPHDDSPAESSDEAASTLVAGDRSKTIITLDTQVSESGNNFSSGQRQLIAMARALLRRSRFVVMDESTASVDFATDLKIQEAIREEFKDSILVTIAHRLRTVIDYDRILVLDAGNVAEFDTPKNLIAKEDGIFHGMCVKSGDFEELKEAADRHAEW